MLESKELLSYFGLSEEQTRLLFSLQASLVRADIDSTKNLEKKVLKQNWLDLWIDSLNLMMRTNKNTKTSLTLDSNKLIDEIKAELIKQNESDLWYQLLVLESVTFKAYGPIEIDQDKAKVFSKLVYKKQNKTLKELLDPIDSSSDLINRFDAVYRESMDKASGKWKNRIIATLTIITSSALLAAFAAIIAPHLAVLLVGPKFVGLSGAALATASLAYLGGGAIAIGGLGISGGVAIIVGGGALLGAASSSIMVGVFSSLAKASPNLAYSQAAKLSVVLREIILNQQKDILLAQEVMQLFKAQILELQNELSELKLEQEKDNVMIKNLTAAIEGLERQYKENIKFTTSFDLSVNGV